MSTVSAPAPAVPKVEPSFTLKFAFPSPAWECVGGSSYLHQNPDYFPCVLIQGLFTAGMQRDVLGKTGEGFLIPG